MKRSVILAAVAAFALVGGPAMAADGDPDPAFADAVTCAALEALLSDADAPPMDAATYAKKAEAILDGTDPKLAEYSKKKVATGKSKSISEANNMIGSETKAIMEAWSEKPLDERVAKFNSCAADYGA
jgi:hypothetical protein